MEFFENIESSYLTELDDMERDLQRPGAGDRAARPAESASLPDLSWMVEDTDWNASPYNPVRTLVDLRDAINAASDGIPTEILINADIVYQESDGLDIEGSMLDIPTGKIIRIASAPQARAIPVAEGQPRAGTFSLDLGGVDGDAEIAAFVHVDASLYLANITLRNGNHGVLNYGRLVLQDGAVLRDFDAPTYGGAIRTDHDYWTDPGMVHYSTVVMTGNSLITECNGGWYPGYGGGGIQANHGTLIVMLQDASITHCSASGVGGGIYIGGFAANDEVDMPDMFPPQRTFVTDNASITDCTAEYYGGGFMAASFRRDDQPPENFVSCEVFLMGSALIKDCKAIAGGGIYSFSSIIELSDNASMQECFSNTHGGGIYMGGPDVSHLTMQGYARVINNTADFNGGGICLASSISEMTLNDAVQITGNTAGNKGGGIYTAITPNPNLIIPAGVVFCCNKATEAITLPSRETLDVMKYTVFSTNYTAGFKYIYNNYDINAVVDPPDDNVYITVEGPIAQVQLYGSCLCEGMLEVGLYDDQGELIAEARNGRNGAVKFPDLTVTEPGKHYCTMCMKSCTRKGVWLDCAEHRIIIQANANTRRGAVAYPCGIPAFMNMDYCCS